MEIVRTVRKLAKLQRIDLYNTILSSFQKEEIQMEYETHCLGSCSTNSYLLHNPNFPDDKVLIEAPPTSFRTFKHLLKSSKLHVLLTHGHWDHVKDAHLFQKHGAIIYVHWRDFKDFLKHDRKKAKKLTKNKNLVLLRGSETLKLLGENIQVVHTPGHTFGSVCYFIRNENMAFSGDTLFRESVGRTDLKCGFCSFRKLKVSVTNKLYKKMRDETYIYPGHGDWTSIGHEKKNNPFISICKTCKKE